MYFFLAETFMPLEINPKRSSVRAFSIMSVLSSDSGLVMPTVYEATWPSANKLWTYTEQRKNSDFANLFLTLLFTNRKTYPGIPPSKWRFLGGRGPEPSHQTGSFGVSQHIGTLILSQSAFPRIVACKLVTRFCDIFPLQSKFSSALFHTLFPAMGRRDRI